MEVILQWQRSFRRNEVNSQPGMLWYRHLADLSDQEGLTACMTEIFAGRCRKGVAEENHLIVLMMLMICWSSETSECLEAR